MGNGEDHFSSVYRRGPGVSAVADCEVASGMVRRAEDLEAKRRGESVRNARIVLARRIGVGPGTLRNVRKQRRQSIPAWMMAAIRRVLVEVLQAEIRSLQHELHLHLQTSSDHRSHALDEAQARLAEAKAILVEAVR